MLISDTKGKLTTGLSFPAPSGRRQSASPSVCKPILSLCQLFNVKILPITSIQTVIYLTTVIAYNYGKRFLPNKNYIGFLTFVPVPFIYIFLGGGWHFSATNWIAHYPGMRHSEMVLQEEQCTSVTCFSTTDVFMWGTRRIENFPITWPGMTVLAPGSSNAPSIPWIERDGYLHRCIRISSWIKIILLHERIFH